MNSTGIRVTQAYEQSDARQGLLVMLKGIGA